MFRIFGIVLLCYVGYCFLAGQVYGRYHAWAKTFGRDTDPWHYWSTLAIYILLAIALIFLFGRM
jgi:hypothetical protein